MKGVHNFWGRVLIIIGACVVGLIFPFAFIVAAFMAYTIYSDIQTERSDVKPEPVHESPHFYDRQTDYTWQELSDARTESVAEQAFLKAMIEAFDLQPAGDDLAGGGIRFAFQRKILRYRVDFILNDWLIVEIDGAEWHSSPEAAERDGIRDAALRELDYSILRIPAEIVFRTPAVAVGRVRDALKKPTIPITVAERDRRKKVAQPKAAPSTTVIKAIKSIGTSIDTFDRLVTEAERRQKVTSALNTVSITLETERTLIETAIKDAQSYFEREKEFEADPRLRELYEENLKELNELLKGYIEPRPGRVEIAFVAPAATGDADMDADIQLRFDMLMKDRILYLNQIASTLKDKATRAFVINNLLKNVDGDAATHIALVYGETVFDHNDLLKNFRKQL